MPPDEKKGAEKRPEGLLSMSQDEVPGGMRSDIDLVNGLPPETPGADGKGWPLSSKKKREASLRGVADKAEEPMPGGSDG